MEELQPEDIEELLQELEEESGAQESLPQEVEELLHVLRSGSRHLDRREAAERLGNVGTSSPRIVRALRAAKESDRYATVARAAAKSLRAPVHQAYKEQHPDLIEATESALEQLPVSDTSSEPTDLEVQLRDWRRGHRTSKTDRVLSLLEFLGRILDLLGGF
jgi:hypothetical protein